MSRLKKLNLGEEKAMVQKTVRIPADLYEDFEALMLEARIDSFNQAVVELIRLEVQEWKEEKKKELKQLENESKKGEKKSRKRTSKKQSEMESNISESIDSSEESKTE